MTGATAYGGADAEPGRRRRRAAVGRVGGRADARVRAALSVRRDAGVPPLRGALVTGAGRRGAAAAAVGGRGGGRPGGGGVRARTGAARGGRAGAGGGRAAAGRHDLE